jgi:hypothetical protein
VVFIQGKRMTFAFGRIGIFESTAFVVTSIENNIGFILRQTSHELGYFIISHTNIELTSKDRDDLEEQLNRIIKMWGLAK